MLNKVMIIGNLTRDPELRYTPNGKAVASFGVATNRRWTDSSGERQEEAEFHEIVVWGKLAEICNQILSKGRKVYVEGRLHTRSWEAPDGTKRTRVEIIASDMRALDKAPQEISGEEVVPGEEEIKTKGEAKEKTKELKTSSAKTSPKSANAEGKEDLTKNSQDLSEEEEEISLDDIPF